MRNTKYDDVYAAGDSAKLPFPKKDSIPVRTPGCSQYP